MEIETKKWKYIYTIFCSYQFCMISLNNATVLLKSVHAVRRVNFKNDKFFTWEWISRSHLNQFTWAKFVKKTDMIISCSNNCLITRSNQKHVTPHNVLGDPRPFLMESNLKLKILRLHRTIPDASPDLIQQMLYRIEIRAGLFWFLLTLDCLIWEDHMDELNWLRLELEWKPIVSNLSILEMTPCLYTGVEHERV